MPAPPDLSTLTSADKDALIVLLWTQVQAVTARVAELEAKLQEPAKTADTSSVPPSQGPKANRPDQAKREGPRRGSLGRRGGGRALAQDPDQFVIAKPAACVHCRSPLVDGRPETARPLWQDRSAAGPPGDHTGGALRRLLPVLRQRDAGTGSGRPGARPTVQPLDPGVRVVSARCPRHQRPAPDPAVPAPVRPGDQRRRSGYPVPAGQAAVRR